MVLQFTENDIKDDIKIDDNKETDNKPDIKEIQKAIKDFDDSYKKVIESNKSNEPNKVNKVDKVNKPVKEIKEIEEVEEEPPITRKNKKIDKKLPKSYKKSLSNIRKMYKNDESIVDKFKDVNYMKYGLIGGGTIMIVAGLFL